MGSVSKSKSQGSGPIYRCQVCEAIVINDNIVLTKTHPVLTIHGWISAGALQPGMVLRTLSGDQEPVVTVEPIEGEFSVIDLAVYPSPTFAVHNMIVHNADKL